ncbi:MAG: dTMP kinase [Candidatus Paceibacterota bacterium]
MLGKLFIFEGGEGAGKTTLIKNLSSVLTEKGYSIVTTREPGGTPYAEEVREALIKKRANHDDYPTPRSQLLGFYSARFDHIEKVIVPALREGKVVLCDRFELTSYAYQVHSLGPELHELFMVLHAGVCELLREFSPTYIVCELDPETGVRRALSRDDNNTSFDEKNMDFHYKANEGRKEAQKHIDPCFTFATIDASRSPEEMMEKSLTIMNLG